MLIRVAIERDAEKVAKLIQDVENSSRYMLFGPGERPYNPNTIKKMIQALSEEDNSNLFLAEAGEKLAGYLIARGGSAPRNKHTAYLVIGILENWRGNGIGTKLFERLLSWASDTGIHRLELTVVTENLTGLGLYKKMGFEIEGSKKDSLLIDGKYVNEFYMSRIL
ncbi:GNAT family N-acetyltransferase [Mesobacillus subterraneus]|uniref:GNAT family N-acetyltransferase n=1 Tax=Mesobacillus subterraneus TaxID=285983 RepID=A0A427TM76_9BACI|nr:GNAT family N-acetyltransferase [Mesobacillus subterraneus]RSD25460.1 GNAT family N-acetyltransferase [Mesobacillus subterraneus]